MTAWIENGDIRPLIDREYSLEEVGKALEYVEA
jgi:NADPH:quinone reductase-like Zn-dependent oxidoreductase